MDKPTKPTDLVPRSFGGVKNNFSPSLQSSGYEDGIPAIYGGDNLNYQLDATGKELDYCEKICDYINAIPINKTPIVDANNKLVYTQYDIRVYNATETYYENDYLSGFVDGEKHIYRCKQDNVTGQALSNDTYFERVDIMGNVKTVGRNIGEIVTSTIPLVDAGLHLLDGSLLQYGSYKAFIDYIADLYTSGDYDDIFETEANWQTSVTTYDVCGKFVYDSVNNTVRLPKVIGFVEGTIDPTVLGDLVQAGLPNITGKCFASGSSASPGYIAPTGAFTTRSSGENAYGSGTYNINYLSIDASRSSSIYGNSNTVQPQSIKVLYYIVIATTTKTDVEADLDEIATDLNGKADVDMTNINSVAKTRVVTLAHELDWDNKVSISTDISSTSKQTYTCTDDGVVFLNAQSAGGTNAKQAYVLFYFDNDTFNSGYRINNYTANATIFLSTFYPFVKGETASFIIYSANGTTNAGQALFVPYKKR